jgi:hypothetical protein
VKLGLFEAESRGRREPTRMLFKVPIVCKSETSVKIFDATKIGLSQLSEQPIESIC